MGEFVALDSSMIAGASYDQENMRMTVQFTSGQSAEYGGIQPEMFNALIHAPSPGKYFTENIRRGGYPFRYV